MVTIQDLMNIELKVAKILEVRDHPNADKLLVLTIDLGGETRQIVAGRRGHYEADALVGKEIVVVANLEPANLRGEESNGMLLAAVDGERVVVVSPEQSVSAGSPVK